MMNLTAVFEVIGLGSVFGQFQQLEFLLRARYEKLHALIPVVVYDSVAFLALDFIVSVIFTSPHFIICTRISLPPILFHMRYTLCLVFLYSSALFFSADCSSHAFFRFPRCFY